MGRIRSIKPEFPQSESVGRLSRDARLLFIELWTIVDDDGRTRAASRMLASLLFPYDDDAPSLIGGWLGELEEHGFVVRYEASGSQYLEVVNWRKHQKIDHPTPSKTPGPFAEGSRVLGKAREDSGKLAPDLGRDLDRIGIGTQKKEEAQASEEKAEPVPIPADWRPTSDDREFAKEQGLTDGDVAELVPKHVDLWRGKGTPKADWSAVWRHAVRLTAKQLGRKPSAVQPNGHDPPKMIFVPAGTPAFGAWRDHFRLVLRKPPPIAITPKEHDFQPGYYFPTEYPPPSANGAAA